MGAAALLQLFCRQVLRRAVAARRIGGVAAGPGAGLQRFAQCSPRRISRRDNDGRHESDVDDTQQIVLRREIQLAIHTRIDGIAAVGHQQGITVGSCAGHTACAYVPAGAGTVLHDHGLAQVLFHPRRQFPGQHIGSAARWESDHKDDGLVGIVPRLISRGLGCCKRAHRPGGG